MGKGNGNRSRISSPLVQSIRFELVINLNTAKALEQWLGSTFAPTDAERRDEDGQLAAAADGADVAEAALVQPLEICWVADLRPQSIQ
jgi:hypothetical protein